MASGRSWRLTPDERRDLWRRWRVGQTLTAIGEARLAGFEWIEVWYQ